MARTNRVKKETDACYHVTSRTAGKRFLLESPDLKRKMVGILSCVAEFSGVSVFAYCVMDDHFHVVCKVVKTDLAENEVIRRIGVLKGEEFAKGVALRLGTLRGLGRVADAEAALNRWRRRMEDLSEFVKTFKETFDRVYRKENPYNGSIWDGRFKSTLVETGDYLRRVVKYVNFNPVRAHMVSTCDRYEWCTAGSGSPFASRCRAALAAELGARLWGQTPTDGEQAPADGGQTPADGGQTPVDGGQTPAEGGQTPDEGVWLMRRMPQFASGKLFGSLAFVEAAIGAFRWGARRTPRPHAVAGGGFASHGQRLARAA